MEDSLPQLRPISDDLPAGSDVRYEPEFEELQREIDKLSLPSSTSGVDWARVRELSGQILTTRSKDLLVASYLCVAELRLHKLAGLAMGLHIFAGLLELYWETLFPAKKRMRGRLAAVEWLLEKSEAAAEVIDFEPAESDYIVDVRETIGRINAALRKHCDEAPLLNPLERIINAVPLRDNVSEPTRVEKTRPADQAASAEPETPAKPLTPQESSVRVEPAPIVSAADTLSVAEMEKILRGAFQTVKQAGDFYFDKDLANPRGYRCRRIAGWAMLQSLPPATDGQTQILPPREFELAKKRLHELRELKKWRELLQESERKMHGALLWLDLNRFSADSLSGLGNQYETACDAVCQETSFLLTRLPGLEKLAFADGTPLADAETRQWLETIGSGSGTTMQAPIASAGSSNGHVDQAIEQARGLAAAKKLTDATRLLASGMVCSQSRQERLLWQMGLAQVLVNYRQQKIAAPHLEEIISTIETHRIELWDPHLAIQALRVVWLGYRNEKDLKGRADEILAWIARIDPVEAMILEKG